MSYGLLWIEMLLGCLLYAAMLIAVGMRHRKRTLVMVLCALGVILPLIPMVFWVFMTASLKFFTHAAGSGFEGAVILTVLYFGGAILIRKRAGQLDAAEVPRAFTWQLTRIVTAWIGVSLLAVMTAWNMVLQVQVEVQALRAQAGAMALSVAPPSVGDSANAAPLYEKARSMTGIGEENAADDKGVDYQALEADDPRVGAYVQRHAKRLDILRRAADMPECVVGYPYLDAGYAEISREAINGASILGLVEAARLVGMAARHEAAEGKMDEAFDDCRRIYAMAYHASSGHLLVSNLVSMAIDRVAAETTAQVLERVTKKEQLGHFEAPEAMAIRRILQRCLRGEEAYSMATICDQASGTYVAPGEQESVLSRIRPFMWITWLRQEMMVFQETYGQLQAMAPKPYFETADERKKLEEEFPVAGGKGLLNSAIFPTILKTLGYSAEGESRRWAVTVADAAVRFRLERGAYPGKVEELVPGFLEAVPVDPIDGKALHYKKREDGSVVIYSVGVDGVDDGGDVEVKKDSKKSPKDAGILLQAIGGK